MRDRSTFWLYSLLLVMGLCIFELHPLKAQQASDRPGDAHYTPTKLEWAALELQAQYGNVNYSNQSPVIIHFMAGLDGKTVVCVFHYLPSVPASVVKQDRDVEQQVFTMYAQNRHWPWLRLEIQEKTLPTESSH